MKRLNSATIFLLIFIILALNACGKKKTEDSNNSSNLKDKVVNLLQPSVEDQALLAKLPNNTLLYGFVDLENPKYQTFLKSPFAKYGNVLENLSKSLKNPKMQGKDKMVTEIFSKFSDQTGQNPLSLYRQSEDRVSNYLFFIAGNTVQDFSFNAFAYSKEKKFFSNNFEKITEEFTKVGLTPSTVNADSKTASLVKTFDVPDTGTQLHILANDNYLALSTSQTSASRLFIEQEDKYDLKTSLPKELLDHVSGQPIVFAVANFEKILQLIPGVGLINPKYKQMLNLIPRQALFTSDYDQVPETKLSFHLPIASLPTNLQGAFANGSSKAWETFSASTFFGFNLNLGFVKNVLNFIKTDIADPQNVMQTKTLTEVADYIPASGELGIALTNFNITGFPDLQLTLPMTNATEKIALLKSLITSQKNAGLGNMQWQEKLIAEQPVEYMVTPFGIGLYINTTPEQVRIGTSETALKELITPTATLLGSLDSNLKFAPKNAITSFYLDYAKLYRVAQSFRSMMAMFIPPDQSTQVDSFYKKLEELKNLVVFGDSSYQNDILEFKFNVQTISAPTPAMAPQG